YLEFVASDNESVVYQDYLYSPYKLRTSIHAVKEQFPEQGLVTIIELNPYDISDKNFLNQYKGAMAESNHVVVLVNKDAIKDKNIILGNLITPLKEALNHESFSFLTEVSALENYLQSFKSLGFNLLFMISPNQNSLNIPALADTFFKNQ